MFDLRYFEHPYKTKECKEFWDDWGSYNLYITLFHTMYKFEYNHGRKIGKWTPNN
jgi:hypothetical protein